MNAPREPQGHGSLVGWLTALLRYTRSLQLQPGRGYRLKRGDYGTILEIDRGGGGQSEKEEPELGLWGTNGPIGQIELGDDGTLWISGMFTEYSETGGAAYSRRYAAEIDPDTLGPTFRAVNFAPKGTTPTDITVCTNSAGKVLLTGSVAYAWLDTAAATGGGQRRDVARFDAAGNVESFAADYGFYNFIGSGGAVLQSDGGAIVRPVGGAEYITSLDPLAKVARNGLAFITSSGTIDTTSAFFSEHDSSTPYPVGMGVGRLHKLSDSTLLVGVSCFGEDAVDWDEEPFTFGLLHMATDQSQLFTPDWTSAEDLASGGLVHYAEKSGSNYYIAGTFTRYGDTAVAGFVRHGSGGYDSGFDVGAGFQYADNSRGWVRKIHVLSSGKLLVCGAWTKLDGTARGTLVRLNDDGTLDTGFTVPSLSGGQGNTFYGLPINNVIWDFHVRTDGKIIAVGDFTTINSKARNRIALLDADGVVQEPD